MQPGDTAPRDGTIRCDQDHKITYEVKAGDTIPPTDKKGWTYTYITTSK